MERAIFIGQAMPRHKTDLHDWPSLNKWLYSIGLTDEEIKKHFFYSALVDYFPGAKNGSHLVPTETEILDERPRLLKEFEEFRPDIVVPIGALSISYCLGQKKRPLTNDIGKIYYKEPYSLTSQNMTIIPLPHPSGASTWRYKPGNIELLHTALCLLKEELHRA